MNDDPFSLRTVLRHWFTGKDNQTHDLGKFMAFMSFMVGLGLEVYSVVCVKEFNFLTYGAAIAAMATGIAAMLRIKMITEPDQKDPQ